MPISGRPRDLIDVLVGIFGGLTTPQVDTPGQAVNAFMVTYGSITTAGLAVDVGHSATWIAIGNGTGTFSVGDTTLVSELARSPVLSLLAIAGRIEMVVALIPPLKGNGMITEVGVFGGSASSTANSGTLYAHPFNTIPVLKTVSKHLYVEWTAT